MKQKLSELIKRDDRTLMLRRMQEGTTYMLIIRGTVAELHTVEKGRMTGFDYITIKEAVQAYQQHDWSEV